MRPPVWPPRAGTSSPADCCRCPLSPTSLILPACGRGSAGQPRSGRQRQGGQPRVRRQGFEHPTCVGDRQQCIRRRVGGARHASRRCHARRRRRRRCRAAADGVAESRMVTPRITLRRTSCPVPWSLDGDQPPSPCQVRQGVRTSVSTLPSATPCRRGPQRGEVVSPFPAGAVVVVGRGGVDVHGAGGAVVLGGEAALVADAGALAAGPGCQHVRAGRAVLGPR